MLFSNCPDNFLVYKRPSLLYIILFNIFIIITIPVASASQTHDTFKSLSQNFYTYNFLNSLVKVPLDNSLQESPSRNDVVRVLSLDGGGIRSIMQTYFLEQVEKAVGKPISEIFHLIAGTSAGGIVSAGLTVPQNPQDDPIDWQPKFTAADLTNLFKEQAGKIFCKKSSSLWGFWGPRYDSKSLESLMEENFHDTTFDQTLTPTLILAHDLQGNKAKFFKSWNQKEIFYTKDVVLATSAAPTYFEPRKVVPVNVDSVVKNYFLSDGGTCANNPTACALVEVKKLYPHVQKYEILSLGTGTYTDPLYYEKMKNAGFVGWGMNMVNISIDGPSNLVHQEMQTLYPNSYFRWNPSIDKDNAAMDNISPHNISYLLQAADDMISNAQHSFNELINRLNHPRAELIPIYQTNSLQNIIKSAA